MTTEDTHAFAALAVSPAGDVFCQEGMSLRDWFAGQALASVIDVCRGDTNAIADEVSSGGTIAGYFARKSYEVADAMIAARSTPSESE